MKCLMFLPCIFQLTVRTNYIHVYVTWHHEHNFLTFLFMININTCQQNIHVLGLLLTVFEHMLGCSSP